jgi:enolase
MIVKRVNAKEIKDSRGEKTISVSIETNVGKFSASAPNGKSRGKYEAKPYKKDLKGDIKTLKEIGSYFSEDILEKFEDLKRIEDITEGHVGANTTFALESAILKAMAKEQKKEIWQLLSPSTKKFPRLVGNCVGGGKHSKLIDKKRPDFQEFLLIPKTSSVEEAFEKNKKAREITKFELQKKDSSFQGNVSDEKGWQTSLNEKNILELLEKTSPFLGLDVAASSFYKRKKYHYENPVLQRTSEEQLFYLSNLISNFNLFYIEDPFEEEDFVSFSKLLKEFPKSLIVGDDLTVTNLKRLKKAVKEKSINALIVKPNQNGSLIEVAEVCNYAKENNIKIIFSHRSGETQESILADLAFGFQAEFIKCGITGKEREIKVKRLIEIEKSLK